MESAKECVETHLLNELSLKMDGAEADHLYATIVTRVSALISRRVWGLSCRLRREPK